MAAPAEVQRVIREAFPKVGELKHLKRPGAPDGWAFQMSAGKHAEVWLKLWERREDLGNRVYRGAWPRKVPPRRDFSSKTVALTGISRAKSLWILMLPVRTSWEAIAYHYWGGWNDAPYPAEQVVMLKSWNERFGAEWASDGGDFIELYCTRPPETREAAMKLAREQFVFCIDIVDQGCETLERLAFELLGSRKWFFWWD